ncbi:hypothetical protein [Solimicrobium silvestre]|uniref:Lipoprotein n=1 Tax=Solimicrobium silvestre TaxID=2099400 RepID=A0A2S9H164_9BURK|nr:hypothetical protein [Solimicrobium silvestre]PRC93721.1 hypothetical protein S2091_1722 [Solimicrobium silvestre]
MKFLKLTFAFVVASMVLAGCGGSINATIGGTVSGLLAGNSVGLTNNGTDAITVVFNSSGTNFTFDQKVSSGSSYNVVVTTQPTGLTCTVVNGSGTVAYSGGNVTDVQVTCSSGGTAANGVVSASITGLASGAQLILLDAVNNVPTDTLTVTGTAATAAGTALLQNFPTSLSVGSNYTVSVGTQPTGHTCTVTSASGTISSTTAAPSAIVTCQ